MIKGIAVRTGPDCILGGMACRCSRVVATGLLCLECGGGSDEEEARCRSHCYTTTDLRSRPLADSLFFDSCLVSPPRSRRAGGRQNNIQLCPYFRVFPLFQRCNPSSLILKEPFQEKPPSRRPSLSKNPLPFDPAVPAPGPVRCRCRCRYHGTDCTDSTARGARRAP